MLDVAVHKRAAVVQLLTHTDQALLVSRYALLVLDPAFDMGNGSARAYTAASKILVRNGSIGQRLVSIIMHARAVNAVCRIQAESVRLWTAVEVRC